MQRADDTSTLSNKDWQPCPLPTFLQSDEIHVWRVPLNPPSSLFPILWDKLNQEEQQRAKRFRLTIHQEAFVAARSALRFILSRYANCDPEALEFEVGSHGKPYLRSPSTSPPLTFNVAHSAGLALLAISLTRQVGIDVEHHRSEINYQSIAERICSPREKSSLFTLPLDQQRTAFFSCWTRKEAYVKAIGKGLIFPLHAITVSLLPGEPAALIDVAAQEEEPSRWSMCTLSPGPEYTGALVGDGHGWKPYCWQWDWDEIPDHQRA